MDRSVTIVTVCYDSMAVLPDMLKSVPAGTRVVLVNNRPEDQAALVALAQAHGATVLANARNLGFGAACNLGAAEADTEFLLFLNPDTALHPGAIDALVRAAAAHPQASGFNPKILDSKGRHRFRRGSKIRPAERWTGPIPSGDAEIPVLAGSAIFCRRALFDEIGGFDPAIFMYHEDDDLSFRLRAHGPLYHCPEAIVTHLSGHGSPRSPATAAFKAYHSARSRAYAMAKYNRRWPRAMTVLAACLRVAGPDTLLVRRRRAKNIGYLKGALSALRDGGEQDAPGQVRPSTD